MLIATYKTSYTEYIERVDTLTCETFLSSVSDIYEKNEEVVRFFLSNIESITPNNYIGSDVDLAITGPKYTNIGLAIRKSKKITIEQYFNFMRDYLKYLQTKIENSFDSDEGYILELAELYQRIYGVNQEKFRKQLRDKLSVIKSSSQFQDDFVLPKIVERIRTLVATGNRVS